MESKMCMNASCRTTTTPEWKKGWSLRSVGFAHLCYNCGSAYENSVFCDMFHKGETGWRDCSICGKSVHCGCIASKHAFEHLDFGGIGCVSCAKTSQPPLIQPSQIHNGFGTLNLNNMRDFCPTSVGHKVVDNVASNGKLAQLRKTAEIDGVGLLSQSSRVEMNSSVRKPNGEGPPAKEVGNIILNATQQSVGSSHYAKTVNDTPRIEVKEMTESLPQPSLSISLAASSRKPIFLTPSPDIRSEVKVSSSVHQGRSLPILPKPQKASSSMNSEANTSTAHHIPIARPPADGRGKTQLLPRYWPRISDQELQQISGNFSLNSTIVPLFEKVLSASDAGKIGRLVLPKACAEAYFPHISQSEGIPLKIQDIKGKEWTFQFRFWPNNNSRMYVMEGVTPCIQSMQLQAGDTVIFSRRDPGGKLVIGSRKASNSRETQDLQPSHMPNGNKDCHPNGQLEHSHSTGGNIRQNSVNNGNRLRESCPVLNSEKKKTRNIGSKGKRLLMHNEDSLELRLTWEETQDLLRPPPSVKPSIVIIEDLEFEEYDEPPVFGKRTIFTARESGEQDQWAQCDDCSKWRRLPVDILLPPKWTCSDNAWDLSRCSCSAIGELNPKELDHLFRMSKDVKKRKSIDSHSLRQDCEPSGLDALASAAVLGDTMGEPGDAGNASVGTTTKHPRHRPGCTCIVCIQPPSGMGKHNSTCTCNVCMTVKRRFKTLMLRKKKRQSETPQTDHNDNDNSEKNGTSKHASLNYTGNEEKRQKSRIYPEAIESSNGQIDLNCDPEREDMQLEETGLSMMSSVQAATCAIEDHATQNGLSSLNHGEQAKVPYPLPLQTNGECEKPRPNEGSSSSSAREHHSKSDEGNPEHNLD